MVVPDFGQPAGQLVLCIGLAKNMSDVKRVRDPRQPDGFSAVSVTCHEEAVEVFGMKRNHIGSTEVLVVGAGPVGLWTAVLLSERGIPFQILDRENRSGQRGYALTLHPSTLKMFTEVGLLDEVMENGHRVDSISLYDGAIRRAELNLSKLTAPYPFLVVLPQSSLEEIFERRLQQRGVDISWNRSVADLEVQTDRVRVAVDKLESVAGGYAIATYERVLGGRVELEAKIVIGADGYRSSVRRLLGIPFVEVGTAESFAIIEFESDVALGSHTCITLDQATSSVVWPLAHGRYCGVFQLDPNEVKGTQVLRRVQQNIIIGSKTYPQIPDAIAVELVRRAAPWFGAVTIDIEGALVARFEHRLAQSFGKGPVWLCGDAARTTGPIGAQSANAGFAEAHDLVSRISQVRAGAAPDLMRGYGEEHLNEWRRILTGNAVISFGEKVNPWISECRERLVADLPVSGADLVQLLAQVDLGLPAMYVEQVTKKIA